MSTASNRGEKITVTPGKDTYIIITSMPRNWRITSTAHVLDGRPKPATKVRAGQ